MKRTNFGAKMNKALCSFSMIKMSFFEDNDYIGSFVPLLVILFSKKQYNIVDVETVCDDFIEEFGFRIPRFPMQTILNRMKRKYIRQKDGRFFVNKQEVDKAAGKIKYHQEEIKYQGLLQNFLEFCKSFDTSLVVSKKDADELFVEFFKNHDLEIIFASEEEKSFIIDDTNDVEPKKQYLVNRYINNQLEKNGEYGQYLIDCSIGHFYASTILYREFSNMKGKGVCKKCYLDSNVIFDLIGVNGEFRKKSSEEFLADLSKNGTKLYLFQHLYNNEIHQIIEDCLNWIDNPLFNSHKASRALHYFKDEGKTSLDIELLLEQIPGILRKNNIKIIDTIDPNIDTYYQINEEKLQDIILDTYSSRGWYFDEEEREETLRRDIKSVNCIYKLRKNKTPTRINDVSHVFVTSNSSLAYATKRYEKDIKQRTFFTIPPAVTDTFLGTIMWIQKPNTAVEEFNRGKLIAYSNAVIQPQPSLSYKFQQEVKRCQHDTNKPISDDDVTLLLQSRLSRIFLADLTLGDPNAVNSQTPYEVRKKIREEMIREEQKKTQIEMKRADAAEKEIGNLQSELVQKNRFISNHNNELKKMIEYFSNIIFGLIILILAIIGGLLFYFDIFADVEKVFFKTLLFIIQLLPWITGVTAIGFAKKIIAGIKDKLTKLFILPE